MKKRFAFLMLAAIVLTSFKTEKAVKVACVGDSITFGSGIENREVFAYPKQMAGLLGPNWDVQNFGVSGATMLKQGDKPYWGLEAFTQAQAFAPDIVVIKLGTNDSKPQNWQYSENYISDYRSMIRQFRALPSSPQIAICLPLPVFEDNWGITAAVVENEIIPTLKLLAQEEKVVLIDLYTPFENQANLAPDGVHPNAEGAALMAKIIAKHVKKMGKKLRKR